MKTVLVVGEQAATAALEEAVSLRDFVVARCDPADAASQARTLGPAALAISPPGSMPPATFISDLLKELGGSGPPVIVALSGRETELRDKCLIAGAHDVSLDGHPEDLAARVDAAANGWLRGAPRRTLAMTIRGQRERETLAFQVADIDPTGFTVATPPAIAFGSLVRVTVPLPDGPPLVVWGRTAEADGVAGVRFLALSLEERIRILGAIQAKNKSAAPRSGTAPEQTLTPAQAPRLIPSSPGVAPVPPALRERTLSLAPKPAPPMLAPMAEEPQGSPSPNSRPPARSIAPTPEMSPPSRPSPPERTASPTPQSRPPFILSKAGATPVSNAPAPRTSSSPIITPAPPADTAVAASQPASTNNIPVDQAAAAVVESASAPSASAQQSIADAIGDLLGPDSLPPPDAPSTPSPISAPPQAAAAPASRRWPIKTYTPEGALQSLGEALSLGLVGENEGGPAGDTVIAFVRTLSVSESRAFGDDPPADLPEPQLTIRCLELRLRLFALVQDAERCLAEAPGPWEVDDHQMTALTAEVNVLTGELQKLTDAFVAAAQASRIKDINQFRNALMKAQASLRAAVERLKGEAAASAGNNVFLDGQVVLPPSRPPPRTPATRPPPPKVSAPSAAEAKLESASTHLEISPKVRARRRVMAWSVLLGIICIGGLFMYPHKAFHMGPGQFGGIAGIRDVVIVPDAHQAVVTVDDQWRPLPGSVNQIRDFLVLHDARTFVIRNAKEQPLVMEKEGRKPIVLQVAGAGK